jgi:hypothetical protein
MEAKKVFVKWESGDTDEFGSYQAAVEAILNDFASSGTNNVQEVWEEVEGDEVNLSVKWRASLEHR